MRESGGRGSWMDAQLLSGDFYPQSSSPSLSLAGNIDWQALCPIKLIFRKTCQRWRLRKWRLAGGRGWRGEGLAVMELGREGSEWGRLTGEHEWKLGGETDGDAETEWTSWEMDRYDVVVSVTDTMATSGQTKAELQTAPHCPPGDTTDAASTAWGTLLNPVH